MRSYGLLCAVLATACASAGPPGEGADAAIDGVKRDAAIDAPEPEGPNLCASAQTCADATVLMPVSGDSGNTKRMASGYQSAWFRIRVTENDENIPGLTLRVASKLTFPVGVGFETYVYVNASSDVPSECTITTGTRSTVGNVQTVKAEWGEGGVPNGADDSRNVTVEVRPVGTSCSMPQMWQLEVEGNWL